MAPATDEAAIEALLDAIEAQTSRAGAPTAAVPAATTSA